MKIAIILGMCAAALCFLLYFTLGDGAIRKHLTLGGSYVICKPDGYPLLCVVNKDSGAISCVGYGRECKL